MVSSIIPRIIPTQTPGLTADLKHQIHVSATLRVADEMDAVGCILHYGIDGCLESLHLLPHGLQAGAPVKQVEDGHVRSRVGLRGEAKKESGSGFSKAAHRAGRTEGRKRATNTER